VSLVSNTDTSIGTANTVVTLSTGQYGAQQYLIETSLGGSYKNTQQITAPASSPAYQAAHATIAVMIPPTKYSIQGAASYAKLATAAGLFGNATNGSYTVGMKYNNKGTNPQGQIQLVLYGPDGTYFVKSNAITSVAFSGGTTTTPATDVTIYTKATVYKIDAYGVMTSIEGGATLRMDAHDGGTASGDTVGFTVLSSKTSALYYSNNWVFDSATKSWRTLRQLVGPASSAVVIG